jgi:general secretion pathway protein M
VTQQRQRLLALGLLALAVGLIWLLVIAPVIDAFAEQSTRADDLRLQLTAFKARIAMKPVVEMRLADMKKDEASSTGLIGGNSAELAAANVQNIVKALFESDAAQVRSAQNLPPVTTDGFQRIEVQYDVSVPMTRIKDVVYRIETGVPYLFLDGIDMRAPEDWQNTGLKIDPPNVDIRWTMHAYRWAGTR